MTPEMIDREWALTYDPYPMQPIKPGLFRGNLCGGWCWLGNAWFPSSIATSMRLALDV